jgi:phosphate starvation-inducible protein PhoH and related proteins
MARKPGRPNPFDEFFPNGIEFNPLTKNQEIAWEEFKKGKNLVLHGFAGTGKTFLAVNFALHRLKQKAVKEIKIIRSAVPARDLGFLPGTEEQKLKAYEAPYRKTFSDVLQYGNAYDTLKAKGIIQFESTSYLRSLTFDDTFIIVDEIQNMRFEELYTVMTRIGVNSEIMFCGDRSQCDLIRESSGVIVFLMVLDKMKDYFSRIDFQADDIVRSNIVKDFIITTETIAAAGERKN